MTKSAIETVSQFKDDPVRWATFQEWWDEDWSWDRLLDKLKFEAIGTGSLQDYWRDQEDALVDFAGRRWTIAHLPPCNRDGTTYCEDWQKIKNDRFWALIDKRLPEVTLPIKKTIFVHQIDPQPSLFHGVVFPEWPKERSKGVISAYFKKCLFLGWCSFSNAKIANSFFDEARFIGDAVYFDDVEFLDGGAHFSQVSLLCGIVTLSKAKFDTGAHFRQAKLRWPSFSESIFSDGCDFSDAEFVDSGLYFIGAEFGGGYAHFDRIVVDGVADFSFAHFDAVASFTDAEFKYDVYFRCDKGGKFAAAADFNGAIFKRTADFSGRSFNQATDFRGAKFGGLPLFYDCQLARETLFDLSGFGSTPWNAEEEEITLERELEREERERVRRRQMRFNDSFMWRRGTKLEELRSKVPAKIARDNRAKSYEQAFRTLRQLSAEIGNVDDEMNFQSFELEARRTRSDVPTFERGIILLYRMLSDYGQSMWRPVWVALVIIAVTTAAVTPLIRRGLNVQKLSDAHVVMPSSTEVATYLVRNFIVPPPVWSENLGRSWVIGLEDAARGALFVLGTAETFILTVLAALLLIAVRRRFQIRL